jgi:hypothetical protein
VKLDAKVMNPVRGIDNQAVELVVVRESHPFHPGAKPIQIAKMAGNDPVKFSQLIGGQVARIHAAIMGRLWRNVHYMSGFAQQP